MKINIVNNNRINFDTLSIGQTFMYNDFVYMKIPSVIDCAKERIYNVVSLESGTVHTLRSSDTVQIVSSELIVQT